MRLRILSRVDLPAPFRPMMPTTSPCLTSKETSFRAQKSSEGRGRRSEVAKLGAGSRELGAGSWELGAWSAELGAGSTELPEVRSNPFPDLWLLLAAPCSMLVAPCPLLQASCCRRSQRSGAAAL